MDDLQMLNSTQANLLISKINKTFANIGLSNGTTMPESKSNLDSIAWEMFVAEHLAKIAGGRKDSSRKEATKAGVIPDYKNEPRNPGINETVYNGEVVNINLVVRGGRTIIDGDKLIEDLLAAGVDSRIVLELARKHTKIAAPSHFFTPSLVTG